MQQRPIQLFKDPDYHPATGSHMKFEDKKIHFLGAVDNVSGDNMKGRLEDFQEHNSLEQTIILISYNLGGLHWVEIMLEFDATGTPAKALYIDSLSVNSATDELKQTIRTLYNIELQKIALLKQNDYTSCGAYVIENLLLIANGKQQAVALSKRQIRQLHLRALTVEQSQL